MLLGVSASLPASAASGVSGYAAGSVHSVGRFGCQYVYQSHAGPLALPSAFGVVRAFGSAYGPEAELVFAPADACGAKSGPVYLQLRFFAQSVPIAQFSCVTNGHFTDGTTIVMTGVSTCGSSGHTAYNVKLKFTGVRVPGRSIVGVLTLS